MQVVNQEQRYQIGILKKAGKGPERNSGIVRGLGLLDQPELDRRNVLGDGSMKTSSPSN